jgi:hypothetical protein
MKELVQMDPRNAAKVVKDVVGAAAGKAAGVLTSEVPGAPSGGAGRLLERLMHGELGVTDGRIDVAG